MRFASDDGGQNRLFRQIPKMDELLSHPLLVEFDGNAPVKKSAQTVLDELRCEIQAGKVQALPDVDSLAKKTLKALKQNQQPNLRRVVNGTGIILHTNLGRAPIAAAALQNAFDVALGYSNLEYEVASGKRGSRHDHVESLLVGLTGAEAAMIVNNNAAAVLIAIAALANNKEVVVSRGELVEIGGSFRVPDVITQSGCVLTEVGTTNKTHLSDYASAIDPVQTGAILRVHTSNFAMTGFVSKPSLEELTNLTRKHGVPLVEDLGSGCLLALTQYGIHSQPIVADSIKAGVDVVMFSGDKLLGGPQAGIILGRADLIAKMKSHPLARAMRVDKLSIAALEATLRLYSDPKNAVEQIPTLKMLCASLGELVEKAQRLKAVLDKRRIGKVSVATENSKAGGGAMPEEELPSAVVCIEIEGANANEIQNLFRMANPPIIGRITKDSFLLDVRTINEEEFPIIFEQYRRFSI